MLQLQHFKINNLINKKIDISIYFKLFLFVNSLRCSTILFWSLSSKLSFILSIWWYKKFKTSLIAILSSKNNVLLIRHKTFSIFFSATSKSLFLFNLAIISKTISLLNKLGIYSVNELREYYPFRYEVIEKSNKYELNHIEEPILKIMELKNL